MLRTSHAAGSLCYWTLGAISLRYTLWPGGFCQPPIQPPYSRPQLWAPFSDLEMEALKFPKYDSDRAYHQFKGTYRIACFGRLSGQPNERSIIYHLFLGAKIVEPSSNTSLFLFFFYPIRINETTIVNLGEFSAVVSDEQKCSRFAHTTELELHVMSFNRMRRWWN